MLGADRAAAGAAPDGARIVVVREGVQVSRCGSAEERRELVLPCAGEFAGGGDSDAVEAGGGSRPDPPDPLDRQRVEEGDLVLGRDEEEPVRLSDGACDLREVLCAGDPDRHREPEALADGAAEPDGDLLGGAGDPLHAANVEEGFIDRQPLDGRRGVLEEGVERSARLGVGSHPGRHDDCVWAEPAGPVATHRGPDAVRLRLVACGEHDSAADDHGLSAQVGIVALLDGREERVCVGVQDRRRRRHGWSWLHIEHTFAYIAWVQLALDSLDRLVAALEERGSLSAVEASRVVFATLTIPTGFASSLLAEVCAGDSRVVCAGGTVSLAGTPDPLLEDAEFVVFDLETTGLSAQTNRICELGAVRVQALELAETFQSLVAPGAPLPDSVARLTGLREQELRGAPRVGAVVGRFLVFAGDAPFVAHNAGFDQRFLERQLRWHESRRLAEPPLCTAALARRLLAGRLRRVSLASLAHFFGVATTPCHRALPDAEATAEVLIRLIGVAQELGARRLSELRTLAAPRKRRVHHKRAVIRGAPTRPGVYLFRDRHDQVLYVGRARDLRARLRSYFGSDRQRPSVEAALLALERVEWHVVGSEFEAALEELRLIRTLQPPANSRSRRPDRGLYLRRRGNEFVVTKNPTLLGPIGSRRQATLAARALAGATSEEIEHLFDVGPLPRLRRRLADLAESLRYEEAARLRDRIDALEHVLDQLRRLERLRTLDTCLIAPGLTPGWRKAFFVHGGVVRASRPLPPGSGARLEVYAGVAIAQAAKERRDSLTSGQAEDMLLIDTFIRRQPPELSILPLDATEIIGFLELGGRRPSTGELHASLG